MPDSYSVVLDRELQDRYKNQQYSELKFLFCFSFLSYSMLLIMQFIKHFFFNQCIIIKVAWDNLI